jgi:hypothetical protein
MMPEVVAGVRSAESIPVCRTSVNKKKKNPEVNEGASCSSVAGNVAHALRNGRAVPYAANAEEESSEEEDSSSEEEDSD